MRTLPGGDTIEAGAAPGPRTETEVAVPRAGGGRWAELPSLFVVVASTVFLFVQLRPGLLFGPNLDVGGDTAAHVAAVSYFVHNLLPHGQLSGWDPQWFDGFPLYVFYFPLPPLLIAGLNSVFSFAVAFKLVTVLGSLLMPSAAYVFGRMAGFRRPVPAVMAVAMLVYLFNPSFTIAGGNLPSTLAGEFSFSLAIPFGLIFLGYFVRALRTGRGRSLAAVFFMLSVLSHVVPALYFAATALVIALVQRSRRRSLTVFITTTGVGALLAGFWLIRFAADLGYSSSMNYTRVSGVLASMFPLTAELAVQCLAGIGVLLAIKRSDRLAIALALIAMLSVAAFALLPDGLVYNERWLPFWFLTTSLLAGYAVGELGRLAFHLRQEAFNSGVVVLSVGAIVIVLLAANLGVLPGYSTPAAWKSFIPGWVYWNYSGYQAKSGWPEFSRVVAMLERASSVHGCGRLDYEYSANTTNAFGSTLVEMSFPMWTNGCIDTTEGVYYESATTNDFHFLDQAELSIAPSNPVVGIPYLSLNVADGIRHLQLTGVKYFLANSAEVEDQAKADPQLVEVGSTPASADVVEPSPPGIAGANKPAWVLYEIRNSPIVSPLKFQPVVEAGQSKARWLSTGISWYQNEAYWPVPIVRSGPSSWGHVSSGELVAPSQAVPLKPTVVSGLKLNDQSLSFNVTSIGVPIEVKVPYFPNWQATGATGPYEATPNLMVVIPNQHHVVLTYSTTKTDWLARMASLVGLGGLVVMWRRPMTPQAPEPSLADGTVPETAEPRETDTLDEGKDPDEKPWTFDNDEPYNPTTAK